jgi:hypothetical protein
MFCYAFLEGYLLRNLKELIFVHYTNITIHHLCCLTYSKSDDEVRRSIFLDFFFYF